MSNLKSNIFKVISIGLLLLITFGFWQVFGEMLRLGGFRAEVFPFLAVYSSVFFGKEWGAGFSCFMGILLDCASSSTLGYYTMGLMLGAILTSVLRERYFRDSFFPPFFLGYTLYLLLWGIRLLFLFVLPGVTSLLEIITYAVPAGLYSLLLSLPTYYVLSRIHRRLED